MDKKLKRVTLNSLLILLSIPSILFFASEAWNEECVSWIPVGALGHACWKYIFIEPWHSIDNFYLSLGEGPALILAFIGLTSILVFMVANLLDVVRWVSFQFFHRKKL